MANTPDLSTCNERKSNAQLPVDPWRSLAVHFGMLLGVDDFRTIGAYHRGKQWLHNGWLHREGVVWGLRPSYDAPSGELRLEPGLAIDPAGRELHLERRACIDVGKWYAERVAAEPPAIPGSESETIDAHVRIRFVSCSTNEVPAMVEPCEGAGRITAHSRVFETVELELVEGLPEDVPPRYPRLRLLFGLEDASSVLDGTEAQAIRDARASVFGLPVADQPAAFVRLFREYAARDAAELEPNESTDGKLRVGEGVLTDVDPAWLTLATLHGLTMKPTVADGEVVSWSVESLDNLLWTMRPTHVATRDLEELIAASLACCDASASSEPGLPPEPGGTDVAGPRVDLSNFDPVTGGLTLSFDKPVDAASIDGQLEIAVFDGRWRSLTISRVELAPDGRSLAARFERRPNPVTTFRLRFGHNEPPVIGTDGWPLAGAIDEPPPLPHHGRAFVHNVGLRSPS